MKQIFIISIIIFFSSLLVKGQKIETIISKHIEAHGGVENWESIKSMKITGKFTSFSVVKDFYTIKAKPNSFYSEFHMGIHKLKQAYNGKTVWTINPWFEIPFPRKANSTEENVILQKAEFCTPLFHYKEKGYYAEFKGKEVLEGVEVFTIELTKPNGQIDKWYLNTKTYLEHLSKTTWSDFASPVEQESYYDDFRKVGNVTIAFYVERVFDTRIREVQIENIEFDIDVDKSIFELPRSKEIEKLSVIEGDWNVKVDILGRRGWATADSTTSTIKYMENYNILQEKMSYVRYFPVSLINNWAYNSDTKKYRISSFNDFYSNMSIYEGSYNGDSIVYDDLNISFDSTDVVKSFKRSTIKDITKDSFNIEISNSQNKSKNWRVVQKLYYTRKY